MGMPHGIRGTARLLRMVRPPLPSSRHLRPTTRMLSDAGVLSRARAGRSTRWLSTQLVQSATDVRPANRLLPPLSCQCRPILVHNLGRA